VSIQTSCLSRRISLGERKVRLGPPTVRQAVEIIYVLERLEDSDDVDLLMELLCGLDWRGGFDIHIHLRNLLKSDPLKFRDTLQSIILQGYDPEQQTAEAQDEQSQEDDGDNASTDWKLLLSEYCRTYKGKDPFDVWNGTPFPFFMEMLPEARREEGRNHILSALESQFAFGGSKEIMESWKEKAGWKTDRQQEKEDFEKELSPQEQQKNRNALKQKLSHG
jgi:hypothetical protein